MVVFSQDSLIWFMYLPVCPNRIFFIICVYFHCVDLISNNHNNIAFPASKQQYIWTSELSFETFGYIFFSFVLQPGQEDA